MHLCQTGADGQRGVPNARTERVDREATDFLSEQLTKRRPQRFLPGVDRQQRPGTHKRDRQQSDREALSPTQPGTHAATPTTIRIHAGGEAPADAVSAHARPPTAPPTIASPGRSPTDVTLNGVQTAVAAH